MKSSALVGLSTLGASCLLLAAACGNDDPLLGSRRSRFAVTDCPEGSNIIEGTEGDDLLRGTNRDDCILGYGGDDVLVGRGGNDVLAGGEGDDDLDGDAGDDILFGEAGEDLLVGGAGADILYGGAASDILDGERGVDNAFGEAGNDAVAPDTESADGGPGFDICGGTSCESADYRTCRDDLDCAPDARCLRSTACVSCEGETTCRGNLEVSIDVAEPCAPGYELSVHDECVDIDECARHVDDCDPLATCVNDAGAYHCDCPETHWGSGQGSEGCNVRVVALAAGNVHTCALLVDGRVKCWGGNDRGQLGLGDTEPRGDEPGEMGDVLPDVDLGSQAIAARLYAGGAFNCAQLLDGTVVCWGDNGYGQLGTASVENVGDDPQEMGNRLVPLDLGDQVVTSLSTGAGHACAAFEDGSVRCWGNNGSGQLGLEDTETRGDSPGEMGSSLPALDLGSQGLFATPWAGTRDATCAQLVNGTVRCWGAGADGLPGRGNRENYGDEPGEMGDVLPSVPLGTSALPIELYVRDHACALFSGGQIRCWGRNDSGQLGLGDSEARGDDPEEMGPNLPALDLGAPSQHLFGTAGGGCAQLLTGQVKCWGRNARGGLGLGDTDHRGDEPDEMGSALPALSLGHGLVPVEIVGGVDHRCALLAAGQVKCWGSGVVGQHGLELTEDVGDEPGEMGDALPFVKLGH